MPTNLHIALNGIQFASRILKETDSLVRSGLFDEIRIAGLQEDGLPEHETIDAHRTIWRAHLRSRGWSRTLAVQLIKYLEFCLKAFRYARTVRPAVVNVHILSLLPLGAAIKWMLGAKLVYDPHELETETFGLSGLRQTLSRLVERTFIGRADLVIVVGDGINDWYRKRYGLTNTVTVMNCPKYREPARTKRLRDDLGIPESRTIVLHQGFMVPGRGIEELLEAFAARDDGKHVLVLMGYGELGDLAGRYAAAHANIFYREGVDPSVVLEYTASADVGVSYIDNGSLNDSLCLPNKFFEYIMAGLPVLVNDAPEMGRVVRANDIGVVMPELTAPALGAALDELDRRDRDELARNLRRTAGVCSWETQGDIMVQAYRQHVFGGGGGKA